MMKQLLIPMVAFAMAIPAAAQDLSVIASYDLPEGSGDLAGWSKTIMIPSATFAKAEMGNVIKITGIPSAEATEDAPAQVQIAYKDEDWTWTQVIDYADVVGDSYSLTIDDDYFAECIALQDPERGLFIKGQNFTITRVELLGIPKPEVTYDVISTTPVADGLLNDWSNIVEIPAAAFAQLKLGDIVRIKGIPSAEATADAPAQLQLALKDEDWTWTQIMDSADIIGDTYEYTVTDPDFLEYFKLHGLNIKGQKFTVTEITVVREGTGKATLQTVNSYPVAEGDLAGWSALIEIPASAFAKLQLGDTVRLQGIPGEDATADAPAQVQLALKDEDFTWTQIVDYADVVGNYYDYVVDNEEYLEYFKLNGLNIKGQKFVVTNVDILRMMESDTVLKEVGGQDVTDGDLSGWSKTIEIPASVFENAMIGSVVRIFGTIAAEASEDAPAQVQLALKDEDFTWTQIVDSDNVLLVPYEYVIDSEEYLEYLKLNGLNIKGQNFTVTRVSVWNEEAGGGDEPDQPELPYEEISFMITSDGYVGYTANGDEWSEVVEIPASLFADCAKGDRIVVEATGLSEAQIQLAYKDDVYDWQYLVETDPFTDGKYTYELTGKKAPAGLALHGLFIKGKDLYVNRVSFWSNRGISAIGEIIDESVDADEPVEIYTLQGVRVSEMTKGIYIVRKGSKVRKVIM